MSGFKSIRQKSRLAELVDSGKFSKETFDEMNSKTDHEKLPDRVIKKQKSGPIKSLLRRRHTRIG